MGNLVEELLEKLPLINLSEVAFRHLLDSNDKVVGNAIRTLGHLCYLLYNSNSNVRLRSIESNIWIKLCGKTACELSRKIELAILDVTDTLNQRSWRQRSFGKRHAWGACQALSSVLCYKVANEESNHEGVKAALLSLIKCVQYCRLVNEKIASGALSTLTSVPLEVYACHSGLESISGLCLAVCLINFESPEIDKSHKESISELMKHLMQTTDQFDIVTCLNYQDLSQSSVECMYGWMVGNGLNALHFENVVEALDLSPYSSNVSLVQKFRSRAEKQRRDEITFSAHYDTTEQEEDDDEDEL
jgi:hypothetical protein